RLRQEVAKEDAGKEEGGESFESEYRQNLEASVKRQLVARKLIEEYGEEPSFDAIRKKLLEDVQAHYDSHSHDDDDDHHHDKTVEETVDELLESDEVVERNRSTIRAEGALKKLRSELNLKVTEV